MTKIRVFARINTTRSSIFSVGEVLAKSGFKLAFIHGKRLCEVFGISLEQVKAHLDRTHRTQHPYPRTKKAIEIRPESQWNSPRIPLTFHAYIN